MQVEFDVNKILSIIMWQVSYDTSAADSKYTKIGNWKINQVPY